MSNAGQFYFAKQSGKGTPNASGNGHTMPVTDTNAVISDLTQPRAPTISGYAFPMSIYKAGTSGGVNIAAEVNGKHIGYLLYYLSGAVAVSSDTGPEGAEVGVDTYTFTMASGADFTLPYVTTIVSTEDVIWSQMADQRAVTGRFIFGAGAALTMQYGMTGITPSFGADPTGTADAASPILTCSNSVALCEIADAAVEANQAIVTLVNNPAGMGEEMKIGSPYRRDVTILSRAGQVVLRRWVDATTWQAIYFGGGTTWSASPYEAKFEVRAASGESIIALGTNHYSLEIEATTVGWLGCQAPQSAQRITMMEMPGSIVVPSAGEEFSFVLASLADVDFSATPA